MRIAIAVLLCGCTTASDVYEEGVEDVKAELQGQVDDVRGDLPEGTEVDLASLAARVEACEGRLAALEVAATDPESGWAALDQRVSVVELDVADHEARLGGAEVALADDALELLDLDGRLDAVEGDYVVAADLAPFAEASALADYLSIGFEGCLLGDEPDYDAAPDDCVLDIPGEYGTFEEAMAVLERVRIPGAASAVIRFAPGTYARTTPLSVQHPDGARIHIIGEPDDPDLVKLTFAGSHGFVVEAGASAKLAGLTLVGNQTADTRGVSAVRNALVICNAVILEDFGYGLYAGHAATIWCDGAVVRGSLHNGVASFSGSLVAADDALASESGGSGFVTSTGSIGIYRRSEASGNGGHGFTVSVNSSVSANGAEAHDNGQRGFSAEHSSVLLATDGASTGNDVGYAGTHDSYVLASRTEASDNVSHGHWTRYGSVLHADGSTSSGNGLHYTVGDAESVIYGSCDTCSP